MTLMLILFLLRKFVVRNRVTTTHPTTNRIS